MDTSPLVVTISGLRKSFGGVEVLHGVDLTMRGGRVLALLGENGAGKSTTIKVLTGDYRADAGTIAVDGEVVDVRNPRIARDLGFRVIYQEFSDAPDLTVAENISLGALASRGGFVRWGAVQQRAVQVLRQLDVDLDPRQSVGELGVAERQILEIARAMAGSARLLVLDEPTSALSAEEVERLFTFVRRLRDRGVAIVYITHRLDEVNALADDVVIFRDGYVAAGGPVASFDRATMIESMIGRELGEEIAELQASGPARRRYDAGAAAGRRHAGRRFRGSHLGRARQRDHCGFRSGWLRCGRKRSRWWHADVTPSKTPSAWRRRAAAPAPYRRRQDRSPQLGDLLDNCRRSSIRSSSPIEAGRRRLAAT